MQKRLLLLSTLLLLTLTTFSQSSIQLNIHHKLGDADFAMNTATSNNINHDFKVNRLEYYISSISIIHDGGNYTAVDDLYFLVSATETTEVDLGMHNITEVEGIRLYVGVDEGRNHLDPSSYDSSHPLAPQNPSMHWGWSAGYRFVAIEGKGGSSYNQVFQLHGLDDNNYFRTDVMLSTPVTGEAMTINLDADYTRLLEDIEVNSGVIVHGNYGEAKKALENFKAFVFTPSSAVLSTTDFTEVHNFEVYPNPAVKGVATFLISSEKNDTYQILVTDILGRQVQQFNSVKGNQEIEVKIENAGLYLICLQKNGKTLITRKLLVD